MNNYKNILIVRTDRIGDVVLTTPTIRALREAYPEARISILVAAATRELVDGNVCLDEVLVDDRKGDHKGLGGFIKLIMTLRRKKFDCALVLHTKKRTNLLCFLAGIPLRVGYKNKKFGFLLNRPIFDARHKGARHEAQYCLDVLKELGIHSTNLSLDLPVKEEALRWVDQFCQQQDIEEEDKIIAIHPGASDPAKQWPAKRFAELIDIITDRRAGKVILIGSGDARDAAQKILNSVKGEIVDLTCKTTVGQLAGLLMRCDLLVSNDSGPVHVAAGVGTPVVCIFTRNQPGINPERWKPLGSNCKVVSVTASQSNGISFEKARKMDAEYSDLVPTEAVLEAVDALFKLC